MEHSRYADYLGDAVYADFDGFAIILTTEDGISVSNRIVLEPSVMDALVNYRKRMDEVRNELRAKEGSG